MKPKKKDVLELVQSVDKEHVDSATMVKDALHITGAHQPISADTKQINQSYPFDRLMHAWMGKATSGLSLISLSMALYDWAAHLGVYPAKRMELMQDAFKKSLLFSTYLVNTASKLEEGTQIIAPQPRDYRFKHEAWQSFPFNTYSQSFLLAEQWWDNATKGVRGVSRHHEEVTNFFIRQMIDVFSPSNVPWMNPQVLDKTTKEGGMNFVQGFQNYVEDMMQYMSDAPASGTENFIPGETVAATKGKVVYRNHLMELIQYSPTTDKAYPEPILIVPAWIMKYYILDLSPHNSLVKYLVDKGHTVFMISWKNPDAEDRDIGFEDYLKLGVLDALKAIQTIVPDTKIHSTGYCLGGTLLSIAAAYLAREKIDSLKSVTLFAAQTDFEEAGELMLFVDESQLAATEDSMWQQGYLDKGQMAGAFSMLRSNDLIWSRVINDYLMGERSPMNDLMAWNADATRLPFKMHSEYLRKLYLNNALAEGHFTVDGKPVALKDIKSPIFAVGTVKDHVAPWRSVYKLNLYMNTDVTFVLTSGGHNAGIVSEPGHPRRNYQLCRTKCQESGSYVPPDEWAETAPHHEGSWWPAWQKWLKEQSGAKTTPPKTGNAKEGYAPLYDAPGKYVHQK